MADTITKLPVGIQSFSKLINNGFLYIDKTEYIYKLIHYGTTFFLSRPRRFGKSLFLSTLKEYWSGNKELFKGLKIEELEKNNPDAWQEYPVLYFDFNGMNYHLPDALEEILDSHLQRWEMKYEIKQTEYPLEIRFRNLLVDIYNKTGKRSVILVDEYDKSLLETVDNTELHEHSKALFRGFFGNLKSLDDYIQFVFITGVTKFTKVSIFSDLNQLEDISFRAEYAEICGITEEEIRKHLMPEVESMAAARGRTVPDCLKGLKNMYDGYHFSRDSIGVYNPFSLFCALKEKSFEPFWFSTGTPTILVKKLKGLNFDIRQFDEQNLQADSELLSDYRIENSDPIPLLYQTGYLTIKGYTEYESDVLYTLGYPNSEVKFAFVKSLMPEYVDDCGPGSGKDIYTLNRYIANGDLENIKNVFTALFASIPYTGNDAPFEHYFQTVIYIVFTLLGKYTQCEYQMVTGRIDCVVETNRFVYIFEFKRDGSADEALEQIQKQQYAKPYAADSRKIFLIGVNFKSDTHALDEWKVI